MEKLTISMAIFYVAFCTFTRPGNVRLVCCLFLVPPKFHLDHPPFCTKPRKRWKIFLGSSPAMGSIASNFWENPFHYQLKVQFPNGSHPIANRRTGSRSGQSPGCGTAILWQTSVVAKTPGFALHLFIFTDFPHIISTKKRPSVEEHWHLWFMYIYINMFIYSVYIYTP